MGGEMLASGMAKLGSMGTAAMGALPEWAQGLAKLSGPGQFMSTLSDWKGAKSAKKKEFEDLPYTLPGATQKSMVGEGPNLVDLFRMLSKLKGR